MKNYKHIRVSQETYNLLNSNKGNLSFDYVIRNLISPPSLMRQTYGSAEKRESRNKLIKARWENGETQKELAKAFNMSTQTIHRVINFDGKIGY
tara:strand:- start:811 stop:1092 length:282 start_codon:yes stop_codon:yes gene_type:complete